MWADRWLFPRSGKSTGPVRATVSCPSTSSWIISFALGRRFTWLDCCDRSKLFVRSGAGAPSVRIRSATKSTANTARCKPHEHQMQGLEHRSSDVPVVIVCFQIELM